MNTTKWKPLSHRQMIEQINMSNNAFFEKLGKRLDRKGTAYIFVATPFSAQGAHRSISNHYGMRATIVMNVRKRIEHGEPYVVNEYELYIKHRG
jgi:hypothetical protein